MPRYNLECVVLKSINYKDTDRIYTLYSKSKGKIAALAKGVRRISSRRSGNLDTLNHISVGISESTSGYKTISEVKSINTFKALKRSLAKAVYGYYISEIVHKFSLEGHEHPEIFDLLVHTLANLNSHGKDSRAVVAYFEIALMKHLGYELSLTKCASCGKNYSMEWSRVKFNYGLGGLVCDSCGGNGFDISKETANTLYELTVPNGRQFVVKDAINDATDIIKPYVEDILEAKLKSVGMFKDVL